EVLVAVAHRELEAGDRPLGDLGRGDQLGDGRLERLLVGLEAREPLVEQDAIPDRQREQDRDEDFDDQCERVAHVASRRFELSPAFSNIAKVVRGRRNGCDTRTATRSPTRPMRPSVRVTSPQRTVTLASGVISSGRTSPTSSSISRRSGSLASYSTASTAISAWPISVARWPSQIESRPNFSPTNI